MKNPIPPSEPRLPGARRATTSTLALALTSSLLSAATADATAQVRPLQAKPGAKPFTYIQAEDRLPNYVVSSKWGVQGEDITRMQAPLSPEDSAKRIVLQPGFQSTLWASEPQITKPVAMAWDERGRLWIAETIDYPNEMQEPGQGRDRIKICEDTNGDGKADKFTVFVEKISIPTSICFANGGVLVTEGGNTLWLKDTNGDDRADERKVLFSGWGMGDTHATVSNLRYGLDNWVWGTVGYSGFNGKVGDKTIRFGMGVFRFKPDGSELEFIRSSNNNTWGLGISEDGTIFGSTANNNASWYMAIPNRYYEGVSGWSASRMETIADSQVIHPVTENIRQVDQHHKYTAAAGHALYTARAFPREFWNRIAFVAEPTGHLVGWYRLEPKGADYQAVNLGSFLASDDEWSAPIVAEVGPDGAVWVIDWYNYIVQHNPVPRGFKNGKGNAYETTLRDKRHGRIYRVAPTGSTLSAAKSLAGASSAELVAALQSDNQLIRMHAQRILVEKKPADAVPALTALTRNTRLDGAGLNPGATHALWTLNGLGALADHATLALKHPAPDTRRAAVNLLPRNPDAAAKLIEGGLLSDPDAQVRLASLLALAELPVSDEAGAAAARMIANRESMSDRWIREATAAVAARHLNGFGRTLLTDAPTLAEGGLEVVFIAARHFAAQPAAKDSVVDLLLALPQNPAGTAAAVLEGLISGWPQDVRPSFDEESRGRIARVMQSLSDLSRAKLLVLAQKWGQQETFKEQFAAAEKSLRNELSSNSATDASRLAAARNLLQIADSETSIASILEQVSPQASPTLASGMLGALGESRQPAAGNQILTAWARLSPGQKRAALFTLLRRTEWASGLLNAVADGRVLRTDLGNEHWQQLRSNRDRNIAQRARDLGNTNQSVSSDRQEIVQKLLPAAKKDGDIANGKTVFAANCAVCHKFEGTGQNIGPELTGIGARPREDVLLEILDPNRSVEANYRLWTVSTKGGESYAGRLDAETLTTVELTDLTGQKHTVQRKDIATLESSNQSIMPAGFEALGEKSMADLLSYLATSHSGPAKK